MQPGVTLVTLSGFPKAVAGIVGLPHNCGLLYQQCLVDSYAKIESQRLDWALSSKMYGPPLE